MLLMTVRRWSRITVSLLLFSLLTWPAASSAQKSQVPSFSGQATVVSATVLNLPPIVIADTGPLPSSGGAIEASLLETGPLDLGGVGSFQASVLHATTIGQGDRSRSEASVADLNLAIAGNTVSANFLSSRALAGCSTSGPFTSGDSAIAALTINGQQIVVSGSPNQTVALPNGTGSVTINEQIQPSSTSSGTREITVNALHVVVNGVADVVIASSHADIVCRGGADCTSNKDFVTGGGWIIAPSGDRGTSAVAGGIKNSAFWGHLTYIDHGTKMKVKGTGVTAYVIVNPTTRRIEGTCEINGISGTYKVTVSDNGEPGRLDSFTLELSSGYFATGNLDGGNIQLHTPCK